MVQGSLRLPEVQEHVVARMSKDNEMAKMREWVMKTNADIVAAELLIHDRKIKELLKRVRRLEGRADGGE